MLIYIDLYLFKQIHFLLQKFVINQQIMIEKYKQHNFN